MGRRLQLVLCLAALGMVQPLMAQGTAPAGTSAASEAPVRVVVFDHLTQPEPDGLKIIGPAVAQLEREFSLPMEEMRQLAQKIVQSGTDTEALRRDYDVRAEQLSVRLAARQKSLFDPIIAKVQSSLPAYAAATGGRPITLVGVQDIAGLAPGTVEDLSPAYVIWMNAQP